MAEGHEKGSLLPRGAMTLCIYLPARSAEGVSRRLGENDPTWLFTLTFVLLRCLRVGVLSDHSVAPMHCSLSSQQHRGTQVSPRAFNDSSSFHFSSHISFEYFPMSFKKLKCNQSKSRTVQLQWP